MTPDPNPPAEWKRPSLAGFAKGTFDMRDDFNKPMEMTDAVERSPAQPDECHRKAAEKVWNAGLPLEKRQWIDGATPILAEEFPYEQDIREARELLALIHHDGGHHTEAVGFVQSCRDAIEAWKKLVNASSPPPPSDPRWAELREAAENTYPGRADSGVGQWRFKRVATPKLILSLLDALSAASALAECRKRELDATGTSLDAANARAAEAEAVCSTITKEEGRIAKEANARAGRMEGEMEAVRQSAEYDPGTRSYTIAEKSLVYNKLSPSFLATRKDGGR